MSKAALFIAISRFSSVGLAAALDVARGNEQQRGSEDADNHIDDLHHN
ncbi:hypothetical protein [Burkholderia ubonensis]|nr:hypothetical protein [Burkholderia ubonensis]